MCSRALLWAILSAVVPAAYSETIRFKVSLPEETETKAASRAARDAEPVSGHLIVQFDDAPDNQQLAELRARGVKVLSHVPDNAVLVAASAPIDLSGYDAAPLDPRVKVSPVLTDQDRDYVVEFHPDVPLNDARALVIRAGFTLHENPDLGAHRLLVERRAQRARAADPLAVLSGLDEVAYVFPASEELTRGTPVIPCSSAVTELGPLAQYIATVGNGWDGAGLGSAALSYVWGTATRKLPANLAQAEVVRAMNEWSRIAAVRWTVGTNATGVKTIHVVFGVGSHGDPYAFDGPGNVLAHTFYPANPNPEPIAGDMHLDDDEAWRVGANVDLYSVALHELGHALGLGHSDVPTAVMYPYYRMAGALQPDDTAAILRLYAAAGAPVTPPVTPTNPTTPITPTAPAPSPAAPDTTAPSLTILNPSTTTLLTTSANRVFTGISYDVGGVAQVTWTNSLGGNGTAAGTTSWSVAIPLKIGINRITIRAADRTGNTTWRTVSVTRR
jgi:hypothetical protein